MQNKNYVFIAKSLDGFIADKDGGVEWLHTTVENPEMKDTGYNSFMEKIDALVMGRNTFEVVRSFDIPWPYEKPVFVVSNSLKNIPEELKGKVEIVQGTPQEIVSVLNKKGFANLYIDGGLTVQNFLREDLIDELIVSTLPILLGAGIPLFGELPKPMLFQHVKSEVFLNAITQDTYIRKR